MCLVRNHCEFAAEHSRSSPVNDTETAVEAFRRLGASLKRRKPGGITGSGCQNITAPSASWGRPLEVLIAHLLAKTTRIRVGSGGVMLQHYSPYKVAENFNVLASLAPGRVDLGIGRGPGGLPRSTTALRARGEAMGRSRSLRNCWNWSNSSAIDWRKLIRLWLTRHLYPRDRRKSARHQHLER